MSKKSAVILKEKRTQLSYRHSKCSQRFFLQENARLIDEYFFEAFQESKTGPLLSQQGISYAIIALGGYGRSEQCAYSDVDVMLLFDKIIPDKVEELVREIIYPLWDIGLDIGHATRTVDECLVLVEEELEILTSLLDARFVCGMSQLYSKLSTALAVNVQSSQGRFIGWIKDSCEERHNSFGDSSDLLEPNLKNGLGGLRDYHTMLWLGKIRSFVREPCDFQKMGFFSQNEYEAFEDALEFIWMVRNHLHLISKRKCDQLHFEVQETIATALKFRRKKGLKPVERFIGVLHAKMELVKQSHLMFLSEIGHTKQFFINKNMFKRSKVQGLLVSKCMLNFTSKEEVSKTPELLMNIFLESARLKLPLCSAARRTIAECGHLFSNYRFALQSTKKFERLMSSVTEEFNIFNDMLSTGFLVQYIPEFGKIVNRIQYNQYHIYPVDRHSIHVLQTICSFTMKKVMLENSFYGNLYAEIANKKVLHWAALFHDIGKGVEGAEHSMSGAKLARKILKKKGLNDKNIAAIVFLIENHLFLINIAKRRDIDDEETAVFCARRIKDTDRLKMLYLLTVADSISTGPNAWNSWTASLLRDLFLKVLEILEVGDVVSKRKEKSLQKKREGILAADFANCFENNELAKLIDSMPPRYLVNNSEKKIIQHIKLFKRMGNSDFAVKVRKNKKSSSRTAVLCGREQSGYFSKIAGVFTLNGFDILDAKIYSWGQKIVLDIFTINPFYGETREDIKLEKVKEDFVKVLAGELDLNRELLRKIDIPFYKKPSQFSEQSDQVEIDNTSSAFFTIIEVYTYDFPGLLFAITNTLFQNEFDIVYAKIGTHVDQVVDTFYVRKRYGGKIYSKEIIEDLKRSVLYSIMSLRCAFDFHTDQ